MLADSARIQKPNVEWMNKKRTKESLLLIKPFCMPIDAEHCLRQFVNVGYNCKIIIANGVELTFIDVGHILGSAQIIFNIEDEEDGQKKRLFLVTLVVVITISFEIWWYEKMLIPFY